MSNECLFCRMIRGEIKAKVAYEDPHLFAIYDINPQAPVHLLIIPVRHFLKIDDFKEEADLLGKALLIADQMAHDRGFGEKGYRLIINEGEHGGKLVPHFHIHLLGGKRLGPKIVR